MESRARDLHDFFNVAWQMVDVGKARKIVMKVKLYKTGLIKCISKSFAYLLMKNIWIEKIAKLLSHSIYFIFKGTSKIHLNFKVFYMCFI